MNRKSRKGSLVLAALGVSFAIPAVHGATDTWTGNAGDNLWPSGNNWSAMLPPGSTDTAFFGGSLGSGGPNISFGGNTESTGAIQFTGGTSYDIGSGTSDTLTINNNSISTITTGTQSYSNGGTVPVSVTDGAIDLPSGATANQEIDANLSFTSADPFITNASGNSLTLGSASSPGTISLASGSALIPQLTNTAASIVFNDAITGAGSVVLNNSSTKGTIVFNNPNSNYSGSTIFNSTNGVTVQIAASTDTNSSTTFTKGPFGTSTIVVANSSNSLLEAVGGSRTIANPISLLFGLTVANASTPNTLSFTGPITTVSAGRTLTFNTPGNAEVLGASPNSAVYTLGNSSSTITGTGALVTLNDTIVDYNSSTHSAVSYNISSSSFTGTYVIAGSNTYSGGTTFQSTPQQPVIDILSDSSADGTSGPFGSGTVTFNSSNPAILEPVNTDRTVANAISLPGHGFFAETFGTTAHNLTLSGPITTTGGVSTNNMIAGAVLYLGSPTAPSTITANKAAFTLQGQFPTGDVTDIYDGIVDGTTGAGSIVLKAAGSAATDVAVVNLFGNNTYTGGTNIQSGAVVTTNTNFTNGQLTVTGGTYGGGKAIVSAQPTPGATAGVTVVPSLTIDTATAASSSTLDITNNGLVVQNGSLANIQNYVTSGAAVSGGAATFTGPGIISSLAAAVAADSGNTHKTAIGYGLASAVLGITGPGTFLGQTVNPSDVLVRYTLAGDANLDGTVNALDFNALATNYGASSTTWVQGDYNYDSTVNSEDFDLLAANYNDTIANAATSAQPAAALGALVPEPTTLGLVGLSLLALRRRRNSAL